MHILKNTVNKPELTYEQLLNKIACESKSIQNDLENWIDQQELNDARIADLDVAVDGLWASYGADKSDDSHFLNFYKRMFSFDTALALYAAVLRDIRAQSFDRSKRAVNVVMKLLRAEKKIGGVPLLHFSYNTYNDRYIDPYIVTGPNLWLFKALFAYMLHSGDLTHYDEILGFVICALFSLQVLNSDENGFGCIRAGYKHNDKTESYGYDIFRECSAVDILKTPVPLIVLEHNAVYIDLLRLMTAVIDTHSPSQYLREELLIRHNLTMQAIERLSSSAEDSISWPAAIYLNSKIDNYDSSRVIDHYTWLAASFIGVDNTVPWKSINVIIKEFVSSITSLDIKQGSKIVSYPFGDKKEVKGLPFFSLTHQELFITLSVQDKESLRSIIQTDTTAIGIIFLTAFLRNSTDRDRNDRAIKLIKDLNSGLRNIYDKYLRIHHGFPSGMPFSSKNILNYFNTMPSLTASVSYFIALEVMRTGYAYFLSVPVPAGFIRT
ncbi:MAG: hypothetical protein C4541_03525 [Candidatus Auribacter fodinae]|uniref:Uncharacterized protein n=1 Tax=Candidatus Auribacter fodinae TaxID=2093366 RepID=A0A3A4R3R7_9BACT|nr:MAG: hypothetical protein C4541_03525 [Candidatus Auribacter fodinae]